MPSSYTYASSPRRRILQRQNPPPSPAAAASAAASKLWKLSCMTLLLLSLLGIVVKTTSSPSMNESCEGGDCMVQENPQDGSSSGTCASSSEDGSCTAEFEEELSEVAQYVATINHLSSQLLDKQDDSALLLPSSREALSNLMELYSQHQPDIPEAADADAITSEPLQHTLVALRMLSLDFDKDSNEGDTLSEEAAEEGEMTVQAFEQVLLNAMEELAKVSSASTSTLIPPSVVAELKTAAPQSWVRGEVRPWDDAATKAVYTANWALKQSSLVESSLKNVSQQIKERILESEIGSPFLHNEEDGLKELEGQLEKYIAEEMSRRASTNDNEELLQEEPDNEHQCVESIMVREMVSRGLEAYHWFGPKDDNRDQNDYKKEEIMAILTDAVKSALQADLSSTTSDSKKKSSWGEEDEGYDDDYESYNPYGEEEKETHGGEGSCTPPSATAASAFEKEGYKTVDQPFTERDASVQNLLSPLVGVVKGLNPALTYISLVTAKTGDHSSAPRRLLEGRGMPWLDVLDSPLLHDLLSLLDELVDGYVVGHVDWVDRWIDGVILASTSQFKSSSSTVSTVESDVEADPYKEYTDDEDDEYRLYDENEDDDNDEQDDIVDNLHDALVNILAQIPFDRSSSSPHSGISLATMLLPPEWYPPVQSNLIRPLSKVVSTAQNITSAGMDLTHTRELWEDASSLVGEYAAFMKAKARRMKRLQSTESWRKEGEEMQGRIMGFTGKVVPPVTRTTNDDSSGQDDENGSGDDADEDSSDDGDEDSSDDEDDGKSDGVDEEEDEKKEAATSALKAALKTTRQYLQNAIDSMEGDETRIDSNSRGGLLRFPLCWSGDVAIMTFDLVDNKQLAAHPTRCDVMRPAVTNETLPQAYVFPRQVSVWGVPFEGGEKVLFGDLAVTNKDIGSSISFPLRETKTSGESVIKELFHEGVAEENEAFPVEGGCANPNMQQPDNSRRWKQIIVELVSGTNVKSEHDTWAATAGDLAEASCIGGLKIYGRTFPGR